MLTTDDRLAITHTLALNAHLVDGGDLNRLGEVFTADVVYELGAAGVGTVRGLPAVRAAAEKMAGAELDPLAHHVTDTLITSEASDVATAESKILLLMRTGVLESAVQRDTLRREDGAWRISHRVISPTTSGISTPGSDR